VPVLLEEAGVPSGAELSPTGSLRAAHPSHPRGTGKEVKRQIQNIASRRGSCFLRFVFLLKKKPGFFCGSDSCFVTSDITTALLGALLCR